MTDKMATPKHSSAAPVSKVPDRIYLQWFGTDDVRMDESVAVNEIDVTWCSDRINDSDVEYVRVKRRKC
jgi:hypothetical protein